MTRIAPYLVASLLMALAVVALGWQKAAHDLEAERIESARWKESSDTLGRALQEVAHERDRQEQLAVDALRRHADDARAREHAQAELERLKKDHEDLRAYLRTHVPAAVAGWLWAMPDQNGSHQGEAAGIPAGADAQAGYPGVSHERAWTWCKDTDRALDACNADKAALRQWRDGK